MLSNSKKVDMFFCSVNKMEIYIKLLLYATKYLKRSIYKKCFCNIKKKLKRYKRFIKGKRNRRKMIIIDKDNIKILTCLDFNKIYIRNLLLIFTINKIIKMSEYYF